MMIRPVNRATQLVLISALLIAIDVAIPVAQSPSGRLICLPRERMLSQISGKYKEWTRGIGIMDDSLMEIHASDEGSWTITYTHPTGLMCISATGDGYVSGEPPKGDPS